MDYLERVPKTGAYRFRRGIPAHLRPYFAERGVAWRENLGTKIEAEARPRCLEVAARVERLFQEAQARYDAEQAGSQAQPSTLNLEALTRLVADWKAAERSRRAQAVMVRPVMPGWPEFLREASLTGACNLKPREESTEAYMARLEAQDAYVADVIRRITQARGLLIDQDHPAHAFLSQLVLKAWVEVLEAEHRWRLMDYSDLPVGGPEVLAPIAASPTPAPAVQIPVRAKPEPIAEASKPDADNPLFSVAFEEWARLSRPAHRTLIEARTALRQFTELHGDLPIRSIQKRHARDFRDALAKLPKNLTAEQRAKPFKKLVEEATGEHRAPQTVNKTLNLLGGVLSRAAKEGYFDHINWSNPFSVRLDVELEDEDSYEPFTDGDIQKLFASPIFAKGARPKQGRGDTAYWAPLIALYHGTRRQDVLQLFIRDIRVDDETGVHFIDVNRDDGKKVKNDGSLRRIPIHPRIIELGFLDWVDARRKVVGPDGSLWPGFEDRKKLAGRIDRWAKWFHDYLAKHVVDHPRKKIHSFRGTFKRVGKRCDVSDSILDRICGHTIASVGGKYGRRKLENGVRDSGYPLETLAKEIARVRYPGDERLGSGLDASPRSSDLAA